MTDATSERVRLAKLGRARTLRQGGIAERFFGGDVAAFTWAGLAPPRVDDVVVRVWARTWPAVSAIASTFASRAEVVVRLECEPDVGGLSVSGRDVSSRLEAWLRTDGGGLHLSDPSGAWWISFDLVDAMAPKIVVAASGALWFKLTEVHPSVMPWRWAFMSDDVAAVYEELKRVSLAGTDADLTRLDVMLRGVGLCLSSAREPSGPMIVKVDGGAAALSALDDLRRGLKLDGVRLHLVPEGRATDVSRRS